MVSRVSQWASSVAALLGSGTRRRGDAAAEFAGSADAASVDRMPDGGIQFSGQSSTLWSFTRRPMETATFAFEIVSRSQIK